MPSPVVHPRTHCITSLEPRKGTTSVVPIEEGLGRGFSLTQGGMRPWPSAAEAAVPEPVFGTVKTVPLAPLKTGCAIASKKRSRRAGNRGFSLVEMLLAVSIMTFGLLANIPLILLAQKQGDYNRFRMLATSMAERELDQITQHAFDVGGTFLDKDGTWIQMTCSGGASACGNPLTASGGIDFSVAATSEYSFTRTDSQNVTYDVRWKLHIMSSNKKLVVIGVRAKNGIITAPPVNLKTFVAI